MQIISESEAKVTVLSIDCQQNVIFDELLFQ